MGFFNLLTDTSAAIENIDDVDANLRTSVLMEGETLLAAFRHLRDYVAFTNDRVIVVDKQGLTGSKRSYFSVPYGRVIAFVSETKGRLDADSELTLHVQGLAQPVALQFRDNDSAQAVQRLVASKVCR